jgi:hypothetical protein
VKNIIQKSITIAYALGFFIYFEIKEYKRKRKNKKYIDGSIK